jgi:hypothetical protein
LRVPGKSAKIPSFNTQSGETMRDIYMEDQDYYRLINFLLDSVIGALLGGSARDQLMIALGEKAGIWPESTREAEAT